MDKYERVTKFLDIKKVERDVLLSHYTTFCTGGPADVLYTATLPIELANAVAICIEHNVNYLVLGGGSNIIVGDKGFRGIVIRNFGKSFERLSDTMVEVGSGLSNSAFVRGYLVKEGLSGLEFLIGIPGTIGGAVRCNAHYRSPESFAEYFKDFHLVTDQFITNFVVDALVLSSQGTLRRVDLDYISPEYHKTRFKETKDIILTTRFHLHPSTPESVKRSAQIQLRWRKDRTVPNGLVEKTLEMPPDPVTGHRVRQPTLPSPGCMFSNTPNPENHPVGRMLDLCGLKGFRIGGAMVAFEHSNYLVNVGNAVSLDALKVIEVCKERVFREFGVELTLEIDLVGEF